MDLLHPNVLADGDYKVAVGDGDGQTEFVIGSERTIVELTPVLNMHNTYVVAKNCSTCGGKHTYDTATSTWAVTVNESTS
jgi:hypothetical protein